MATAASTSNELVMSGDEIAAEMSDTSDVEVQDSPVETDATDSDDDTPETWMDNESDEDDAQAQSEEGTAPTKKSAQSIREYKANGQTHRVDFSDQERVDQLISLGLGARQVFSERDKLRKQVGTKDKELTEMRGYKDLWDKIEASKGNHDALYEKIFGQKFSDVVQQTHARTQAYESASPEERKLLDYERRMEEMQRKWEEQQQTWAGKEKEVESKARQAEIAETRSKLLPEFHKHEFSAKTDDPEVAERLNAMLWTTTIRNLKRHGDDADLTPEMIRKEFAATARLLEGNATKRAKEEVRKVIEEKKQTAKTQAQVASTRNYTKNDPDKNLARETDPVKLWRKLTRNK